MVSTVLILLFKGNSCYAVKFLFEIKRGLSGRDMKWDIRQQNEQNKIIKSGR